MTTGHGLGMGLLVMVAAALDAGAQEPFAADPEFRPELVGVSLVSDRVRPGQQAFVSFRFRNTGTAVAKHNYRVFVHFEHPEASCGNIRFQYDHLPTVPTSCWEPGAVVTDGPHTVTVPADAARQPHRIHVGVFAPDQGGGRLLEAYADTDLAVDTAAPSAAEIRPDPLPRDEIEARREREASFLTRGATLDRPTFRFRFHPGTGAFVLTDKASGQVWTSAPGSTSFGTVEVQTGEGVRTVPLRHLSGLKVTPSGIRVTYRVTLPGGEVVPLDVSCAAVDTPVPGLRFSYQLGASRGRPPDLRIRAVTLLDNALGVTDADDGYTVLPFRLGEMLRAEGPPVVRRYRTFSGTTLTMCGAVRQGSALLLSWEGVGVELGVTTAWVDHPCVPGRIRNGISVSLATERDSVTVAPIGQGGYVEIGRTYRHLAQQKGWLKTWKDKRQAFPQVDRMFGAADFKPFVFSRSVPSSRYNDAGMERTSLRYTFDEAARNAEHLAQDLHIDRAMYVLAGWIHRGYDNQHPDVLPAAPECGGNDALAACARRVRDAGFLFGLHDNYQDMYEDAPSWDTTALNARADGTPKQGGNWAGGQAWQVCAIKQVDLARRPQNLPAVKALCAPTIYFIDTTFAWPLVTCEHPDHPMTRAEDMHWKSRLCDTAKAHFGLFGSEEGREWAIPHADYFEGLFSHKVGTPRHGRNAGGTVIPLYELIYGDCINLYTHQSDRARPGRASYILDCVLYAENPLYDFGPHVYFEPPDPEPAAVTPSIAGFRQTDPRTFSLGYAWRAAADLERDLRVFVHFTHPSGPSERENIIFQDDHAPDPASYPWRAGTTVREPARTLTVPEGYEGAIDCYVGLLADGERLRLNGREVGNRRYLVGRIHVSGDDLRLEPVAGAAGPVFARGDQGWAEDLVETDRFIKNTYEVTSWVNRLTAETPMTDHRFETADRRVEASAFGDTRIWVNYGDEPYVVRPGGATARELGLTDVELGPKGLLVLAPTFCALHTTRIGEQRRADSVLFTFRSLDGKPLADSSRVRAFHGFGDPRIAIAGQGLTVRREAVVSLAR